MTDEEARRVPDILRETDGDDDEELVENMNLTENNDDSMTTSASQENKGFNFLNFGLTNARSLPPKISSLITAMGELDLDFVMITETWIRNTKDTVRAVKDLGDAENIGLICKNRPSRGGGVCIAFDKSRANLKRFPLRTSKFEVVAGAGKVTGFSKKVLVIAVYVPPKLDSSQLADLCDYLADSLEKGRRELGDTYVCVGGDMNRRDLSPALQDFPEIKPLPGVPSRHGAVLDVCFSNLLEDTVEINSHQPLEGVDGTPSDHLLVSYKVKVKRRHFFTTTTRKMRRFTDDRIRLFGGDLSRVDWTPLQGCSSTRMVEIFDAAIAEIYDRHFPEEILKTRSTDLPWVSRRIRRAIRRKKRRYKTKGKDVTWKRMEKEVREDIRQNQIRHVQKAKDKATAAGNSKPFYAALNLLKGKNQPQRWTPDSLFPGLDQGEVAENCAEFFNGISSEFEQIRRPVPPDEQVDPPLVFQIAGRLRSIKKSNALVPGDLDKRVVTACCDALAVPLAMIYEEVFKSCVWPGSWKRETVTIIPKNSAPASLSETRNISCTPLFSKLLESFLLEHLKRQVRLNNTQFGGIKGLGVDHFLIETWDEILRAVDAGGRAVNLMSIDFQKAFNRMDHQTCLDRLRAKGAQEHLVQLVGAFLYERTMTVKSGDSRSRPRVVNGGAPQGSILGPFLFCVVSEILAELVEEEELGGMGADESLNDRNESNIEDEVPAADFLSSTDPEGSSDEEWTKVAEHFNFFRRRRPNPLDETTFSDLPEADGEDDEDLQKRPSVKAYIDDFNIIEVVKTELAPRHLTTRKTDVLIRPIQSECLLGRIKRAASEIKMLVNEKKTQMLCVCQNPNIATRSKIRTDGAVITSCDSLKILGFYFGKMPDCKTHIENLLEKFRCRLWSLRNLVDGGLGERDLLDFYATCLRPILEYTQVTYHSMLSRELDGALEKAQARALKIIGGLDKSYRLLLQESGMERLCDRRSRAFESFAKKSANNSIINSKWFPLNFNALHDTRKRNVYLEETAKTEKLRKSPIFQMRRYLNQLD